jgi:c-di-GMP-binding flagellar brake protein YcgR
MAVAPPKVTLPDGQKVSVRLPYVGALPATVETTTGSRVTVALAVPDTRVLRLEGSEIAIECTSARGIQRFGGRLVLTGSADVFDVEIGGDCERIQRREWARVGAVVPIRVELIDEPDIATGETSTLNLSGGGVLINDPWRLPLGLDARIEIVIEPAEPPIRALARVVRDAGNDHKGLRFDDIEPQDSERLMRFVRERELVELRMARGR